MTLDGKLTRFKKRKYTTRVREKLNHRNRDPGKASCKDVLNHDIFFSEQPATEGPIILLAPTDISIVYIAYFWTTGNGNDRRNMV